MCSCEDRRDVEAVVDVRPSLGRGQDVGEHLPVGTGPVQVVGAGADVGDPGGHPALGGRAALGAGVLAELVVDPPVLVHVDDAGEEVLAAPRRRPRRTSPGRSTARRPRTCRRVTPTSSRSGASAPGRTTSAFLIPGRSWTCVSSSWGDLSGDGSRGRRVGAGVRAELGHAVDLVRVAAAPPGPWRSSSSRRPGQGARPVAAQRPAGVVVELRGQLLEGQRPLRDRRAWSAPPRRPRGRRATRAVSTAGN